MRTTLAFVLSTLLFFSYLAHAQNGEPPYQIDEQVTTQASWKKNSIIANASRLQGDVYIQFLGMTPEGNYLVQDFYLGARRDDKKASEPYIILAQESGPENFTLIDGLYTALYSDGTIFSQSHYNAGKRDGTWIRRNNNGAILAQGIYRNDSRDGHWIFWHTNGEKWKEGDYQQDKQTGRWQIWSETGKLRQDAHLLNNGYDGLYIEYYDNGRKRAEGHYRNGAREGLWIDWDENGHKRVESHHKNGQAHGVWIWWDEKGVETRRQKY